MTGHVISSLTAMKYMRMLTDLLSGVDKTENMYKDKHMAAIDHFELYARFHFEFI